MHIVKRIAFAFCLTGTLAVAAAAQTSATSTHASMAAASSSGQEKKSLYTRLGGYDAIAAVVDDFKYELSLAGNRDVQFKLIIRITIVCVNHHI